MSTSRPSSPLKSPRFRPYTPTTQAPANLDLTAQPQPSLTQTSSDTSATLNNNTTIDLSTSSSPSPAPEPPTFLAQLEQRWHETYEKLNQAEQACNIISRISPDITLDRFHVEKARNRYAYFQKQESSLREDIRRLTPRPMDPHLQAYREMLREYWSQSPRPATSQDTSAHRTSTPRHRPLRPMKLYQGCRGHLRAE
ncbi:MAG: hypothetical protein J3R72DRAFT_489393 [Linnemannia gamsii]|nr:MAG: hypothetical protein J3R72DRAFT_489393 [Linnemannia gamsii]